VEIVEGDRGPGGHVGYDHDDDGGEILEKVSVPHRKYPVLLQGSVLR